MLDVPSRLLLGAAFGTLAVGVFQSEMRPVLHSAVNFFATRHGPVEIPGDLKLTRPPQGLPRLSFDFYTQPTTAAMRADLREAATLEPQNAFWQQALSVASLDNNDVGAARRHWITASQCGFWNDYYGEMSAGTVRTYRQWYGGNWAWFQLYAQNNTPGGLGLQRASAQLFSGATSDQKTELLLASFRNGRLIRDFCPRLDGARKGISLIFNPTSVQANSKVGRGMLIDRFKLAAELRAAGRKDEANEVEATFLSSDSWSALEDLDVDPSVSRSFFGVLPALIALLGVGLVTSILARVQVPASWRAPSQTQIALVAAVTGVVVYLFSDYSPILALLSASAIGLQGFKSQSSPARSGFPMPILARFLVAVLAALCGLVFYLVVSGVFASGEISQVGVFQLATLPLVVICGLLLIGRMTSWFIKQPARRVMSALLRDLASSMLVMVGVGVVIGLPLIAIWDSKLRTEYEKIRLNEPKYAWSQVGR